MKSGIMAAALTAAIILSTFSSADEMREWLNEVPADAVWVIVCADAPQLRERLREVGADELAFTLIEELSEFHAGLYNELAGRLLIANKVLGEGILIIADIDPEGETAGIMERGGILFGLGLARGAEGVMSLTDKMGRPAGFLRYKDGILRISSVRALVAAPVDRAHPKLSDREDFIELAERFEMDRGMTLIVPDIKNTSLFEEIEFDFRYRQEYSKFMLQRSLLIFAGVDRWGASAVRLEFEDGVRIHSLHIIEDIMPPAGEHSMLSGYAWEQATPSMITGRSELLRGFIPALRRALAVFDQDALDEFKIELQEANEDLGFDFEKDFLGNIAGEWSNAIGKDTFWTLRFEVIDPDLFLDQARVIAELGGVEWTPAEDAPEGVRVIKTMAYTIPLWLRVDGNIITLSRQAEPPVAERVVIDPPDYFAEGEKELFRTSEPVRRQWPQWMLEMVPQWPYDDLDIPPTPDSSAFLSVSDGPGYRRIRIQTVEFSPEDIRQIVGMIRLHVRGR